MPCFAFILMYIYMACVITNEWASERKNEWNANLKQGVNTILFSSFLLRITMYRTCFQNNSANLFAFTTSSNNKLTKHFMATGSSFICKIIYNFIVIKCLR